MLGLGLSSAEQIRSTLSLGQERASGLSAQLSLVCSGILIYGEMQALFDRSCGTVT